MRKSVFFIMQKQRPGTDKLRGKHAVDQRLCFCTIECTIPQPSKAEILSVYPASVAALTDLCRNWPETPKTEFLATRLICLRCGEARR